MQETYEMLQKNVVDGGTYSLESAEGWKLGEVTKYTTADFAVAYTNVTSQCLAASRFAESRMGAVPFGSARDGPNTPSLLFNPEGG